jgi:hypothetical protein
MFQKVSDLTLMQHTVKDTTKYTQQKSHLLSVGSGIRKWIYVTVGEMYVVLALFIFMGILQEHTERCHYNKNCLLYSLFYLQTLPLEGWYW